jgi:hypothetical protein
MFLYYRYYSQYTHKKYMHAVYIERRVLSRSKELYLFDYILLLQMFHVL